MPVLSHHLGGPAMPEPNANIPAQPAAGPGAPVYPTSPCPQPVTRPQQLAALQQRAEQQAALGPAPAAAPVVAAPVVPPLAAPPPQREVVSQPVSQQVREEIRLYSHSPLVYWWPVWLVGYILAALSYFGGTRVQIAENV